MRILLLYYSPWWNATAYYGMTLAQGLQAAGHTVWFGTMKNNPAWRRAEEYGVPTFEIDLKTYSPLQVYGEVGKMTSFIRENEIDLVNTLSPQGHLFHILAKKLFGLKAPLVRSCCDVRPPNGHWLNRKMYSEYVKWLIFPCVANYERYYSVLKFPPECTSVIYPGIDVAGYRRDKPATEFYRENNIPDNAPVVGSVARLSPEKGHEQFLQMARIVSDKVPSARFVIIGKEEEVPINDLRTKAAELGIGDKVSINGFMKDPRGVVDRFTVGVITSRSSETISRAAIEFFAAGKPVVSTNVNILREIISNEDTGFVHEVDDYKGMAKSITKLLSNNELYNQISRNVQNLAQDRYNIDTFTENNLAVFDAVLKGE